MVRASLHYGIQPAAESVVEGSESRITVAEQIEGLIANCSDPALSGQLRSALKDPQSVIEIKCGNQLQTATPDMPLRELLVPEAGEVEITVSKPHVGG